MNYFKFECPKCQARIEAGDDSIGLEINCPHCDGIVNIPPPTSVAETPKAPESRPAARAESEKAPANESPEIKEPQILGLTTEIKVELVRAVRELIGDGSHWVPGLDAAGKHVMGAEIESGTIIPLKVGTAGVTHFSIVGAFLHIMAKRNVMLTAAGRSRFLNVEIPEAAARAVAAASGLKTLGGKSVDPMGLSHRECMGLLDELVASYSQMFQNRLAAENLQGKSKDHLVELVNNPERIVDPRELAEAVLASIRALEDRVQAAEAKIDVLKRGLGERQA